MFELEKYKVDSEKVNNGAWVPIDKSGGAELLIARMNNQAYKEELRRLRSPFEIPGSSKKIDDALADELIGKAMAKTILLDWKNLHLNGEVYPYNRENCLQLMTNPEFVEFRNLVLMLCNDLEQFRVDNLEKKTQTDSIS